MISASIEWLRVSICNRAANRSGAVAGAVSGSSFQSAKRACSIAPVAFIWSPKICLT